MKYIELQGLTKGIPGNIRIRKSQVAAIQPINVFIWRDKWEETPGCMIVLRSGYFVSVTNLYKDVVKLCEK